jgi:hypothetical protein
LRRVAIFGDLMGLEEFGPNDGDRMMIDDV